MLFFVVELWTQPVKYTVCQTKDFSQQFILVYIFMLKITYLFKSCLYHYSLSLA